MTAFKLTEKDFEKVHQTAAIITASLATHYTIGELAQKIQMPEKKLKYTFKYVYGLGLYSYLKHKRIEKAKALMLAGEKIKDIIPRIGYTNEGNFSKAFRKVVKELPIAWKKNQLARTG
jgi:AraC-like DNA-binding protein